MLAPYLCSARHYEFLIDPSASNQPFLCDSTRTPARFPTGALWCRVIL